VDELVKVLEDFLNTPTDVIEKMGQAAHERVLERHSIDVEAAKLAKLFAQAISA
jgi:glycosyltransferase involved in cell wall biosynthesis